MWQYYVMGDAGVGDWVSVSGWRCAQAAKQGSSLEGWAAVKQELELFPSDTEYTSPMHDCILKGTACNLLENRLLVDSIGVLSSKCCCCALWLSIMSHSIEYVGQCIQHLIVKWQRLQKYVIQKQAAHGYASAGFLSILLTLRYSKLSLAHVKILTELGKIHQSVSTIAIGLCKLGGQL